MPIFKNAGIPLAFFTVFFPLSPTNAFAKQPDSPGQKLYETHCLRCHGFNAKGSADSAKRLKVDPLKLDLTKDSVVHMSRKELGRLLESGHGKMPAQKSTLRAKQIRAVLHYLQSLQRAYASRPDSEGR